MIISSPLDEMRAGFKNDYEGWSGWCGESLDASCFCSDRCRNCARQKWWSRDRVLIQVLKGFVSSKLPMFVEL